MKTVVMIFVILIFMTSNIYADIIFSYKEEMDNGFIYLNTKKYDQAIEIFKKIISEIEPEIRQMGYTSPNNTSVYTKAVANYGLGSALLKKSETEKNELKKRDYSNGVKALKSSCANGCKEACDKLNDKKAKYEDHYKRAIAQLKNMSPEEVSTYKNNKSVNNEQVNSVQINKLEETIWQHGNTEYYFKKDGTLELKELSTLEKGYRPIIKDGIWKQTETNRKIVYFSYIREDKTNSKEFNRLFLFRGNIAGNVINYGDSSKEKIVNTDKLTFKKQVEDN